MFKLSSLKRLSLSSKRLFTIDSKHAKIEELIKKSKNNYSGVIYFTDGYAPSPTIKIKQSLIWVITPDGKAGDHLSFGKQVQIKVNH